MFDDEPCEVCGVWPCMHTDPDTWAFGDDGKPAPVQEDDG
jgi:ferredoxin